MRPRLSLVTRLPLPRRMLQRRRTLPLRRRLRRLRMRPLPRMSLLRRRRLRVRSPLPLKRSLPPRLRLRTICLGRSGGGWSDPGSRTRLGRS
jgi:hypothetical protein